MGLALIVRQLIACVAMDFSVALGIGFAVKNLQWGVATFSIVVWIHLTMMLWYYMQKDIKCG